MNINQLTDTIIEREIIAQACKMNLIKNLIENLQFKHMYNGYDIMTTFIIKNKMIEINYCQKDTLMSLDDFADRIIIPALSVYLSSDQKFVQEDYT